MRRREKILSLKRNAIICELVDTDQGIDNNIRSRIGGKPLLPKGFEWFRNSPQKGESQGNPLTFLAQFDMKELKEFDLDNMLPKEGMLYFFYDFSEEPIGCMKSEKNGARVFFWEGNIEELEEQEFPKDLEEDLCIPRFEVQFKTQYEAPMCEEYIQIVRKDIAYDTYDEELDRLELNHDQDEEIIKVLGYADLCQGSMLLECEMISKGIDCNNFEYLEYVDEHISDAAEWILLFQVDTISNSDAEFMFGDCGRLYFYIRKKDLQQKKFENSWFVVQGY